MLFPTIFSSYLLALGTELGFLGLMSPRLPAGTPKTETASQGLLFTNFHKVLSFNLTYLSLYAPEIEARIKIQNEL